MKVFLKKYDEPFYKHMLGMPVTFHDFASLDEEYYKGLMALLDRPLEELGLDGCYTFSTTTSAFGQEETIDLILRLDNSCDQRKISNIIVIIIGVVCGAVYGIVFLNKHTHTQ